MFVLESEKLRIAVEDPETAAKRTMRFDPTCYVSEIILDNEVWFAASEPRNLKEPTSGGRGLCCEFLYDGSKEVSAGELFPKFGVGLLKKEHGDEKFYHAKKYECVPFKRELLEYRKDYIAFRTLPLECNGYSAETSRSLSLADNRLVMETTLSNTCGRLISTREYCHNFLSLDGMATDEEYSLYIPQGNHFEDRIRERENAAELFTVDKKTVSLRRHNPTSAGFELKSGDIGDSIPFTWKLRHKSCNLQITGLDYFVPYCMNNWCCDHMLCPEVNIMVNVKPGEKKTWRREWIFEKGEWIEGRK